MPNETMYTLVASRNPGRYACDDGEDHDLTDLTAGAPIALLLAGHWIEGRVQHSGYPTPRYPEETGLYSITGIKEPRIGYYFISSTGEVCGLCTGMHIKLLW